MKEISTTPLQSSSPSVFWVHSGGDDQYLRLLSYSVASVNLVEPNLRCLCLVPEDQQEMVAERLRRLDFLTIEIRGIEVPQLSDAVRSRWLKVRGPLIVGEDCIFMDADTMLLGRISQAFEKVAILGACLNRDSDCRFAEIQDNRYAKGFFEKADWNWEPALDHTYFNTGLIMYRYRSETIQFVHRWKCFHDEFCMGTGLHNDQPAFNRAALESGICKVIPEKWNVPVSILPHLGKQAGLYHFYSSAGPMLFRKHLLPGRLKELEESGLLTRSTFYKLLKKRRMCVGLGGSVEDYRRHREYGLWARSWIRARCKRVLVAGKRWVFSRWCPCRKQESGEP